MESYSRIRSVKLKRSTPEHPFGFSVRGGHEHGTGIFVSYVDPRSAAYRQGLKVGDQILRVNGYPVSAAVHHECLALMKIRTSLHLKVRSVGMLPVKEKLGDPLTWKLVEEPVPVSQLHPDASNNPHRPLVSRMSDTSSQPDSRTEFHGTEAKIYIDTSGQSGLGCCICKGPPERPGIFVQSTKSNGVAREAGLRPGDQILQCNGNSFLQIPFAEAVYYLKSSKHLNLLVLKGAASDLFPGESSGYNSSASSLNGDTQVSSGSSGGGHSGSESSSSPADIIVHDHEKVNKRLSMVTEEITSPILINGSSEDIGLGRKNIALDRNIEWDEVEQVWRKAEKECIIIEVKGEDPRGRNLQSEEERLHEERRKLEEEQKRLLAEALRLEEEKRKFEEEKRRTLKKTPSVGSSGSASSTSSESANSLAGALNQEILKRNERRENQSTESSPDRPKPGTVEQKKSMFSSPIDQEKRQQHEQLIEEFKRAHRKMFAHTLEDGADEKSGNREDRESFRAKRIQKETDHEKKMLAERVAGIVRQRQLRIERQHQETQETEREVHKHVVLHNKSPPPPPPRVDARSRFGASTQRTRLIEVQMPPRHKLPPGPGETASPSPGEGTVSSTTVPNKECSESGVVIPPPAKPSALKPSYKSNDVRRVKSPAPAPPVTAMSSPPPPPPVIQSPGNEPGDTVLMTLDNSRPESPSPDYSNSPSPTPTPPRQHRLRQIGVDMESLESFRLKDPPRANRKHPPVYFSDEQCKDQVVKISAYPSAYARPEPSRLEFLESQSSCHKILENHSGQPSDIILHKELEEALSRCSLSGRASEASQQDDNGHTASSSNGKVTIILNNHPPPVPAPHSHHPKSKPNGGILKVANGTTGHALSNGTPKTISFGKF